MLAPVQWHQHRQQQQKLQQAEDKAHAATSAISAAMGM
eukprot:CAMPEP_0172740884 /NCGR_PEP_ID=MMETSP1074-20121228/125811_1 /TAXON_ID=2916 /ORGANISM="Ceratium fusus, Strain PA161109" /LENGTH=37 /DNA_ID= /DNA_START= /DNA_END= /DNA_ORIENTATION=